VLLANYADNSLIRNYVALESAKVLDNMDCYASQYPVDLFINGEYMGVYSLGEQIEVGSSRVELHSNAKSVDTGFFLEIGGTHESDGENSFSTRYMQYIKVLNPKGTSFTEKHKTYIENYFSLADEAVRKTNGYEDFIDIDSLIDWLILTELSFNSDGAMRRSVYMKKDHGGKIEMGPVWDFDIAYGNSETDYENYNAWCCLATDHNYVYENWICALMEDEEFVELLRNRWNEIKNKLYQASMNAFDNGSAMVAPSAAANFEKWNTLGNKVTLQPEFMEQYDTYEKQTEYLKSFIENRFNWIDKQLNGEKAD
jgi:spore coat protein CotH